MILIKPELVNLNEFDIMLKSTCFTFLESPIMFSGTFGLIKRLIVIFLLDMIIFVSKILIVEVTNFLRLKFEKLANLAKKPL